MFTFKAGNEAVIEVMNSLPFSIESVGNRRFKTIDGHLYSDLKDEAVILNLTNGVYYGLNAVGVAIWKALRAPVTVTEIELVIMQEFDVEQERCRREILSFLDRMSKEKLIEIVDE